ncbi:MAG TPA: DUF72 domain-containing protein [Acidimicrobiia bacterium]|nr:DUF72 domain-containing protein [Acidimicrobiia bacterium]
MADPDRIRIGVSGWSYREWAGRFYPSGLPQADRLAFIAENFDTVEVNRSFYSLLKPDVYRGWHDAVPDDFIFAVKGGRYLTHQKKLHDVTVPLANFLASGVLHLGEKLGPILWQLSGAWRIDLERITAFLRALPATFDAAVDLASRHDDKVEAPSWPSGSSRPIRHVLEVRHPEAPIADLSAALEQEGMALAVSDGADWPVGEPAESDFVYVRLHGPGRLYSSRYEEDDLERWSGRIERWRAAAADRSADGGDCYVYFDNDVNAYAPHDALALRHRLGQDTVSSGGGRSKGTTR